MKHSWEQQKEKGTLSHQQTYQNTRKCIFLAATTRSLKQREPHTTVALYHYPAYNNNDHHQQQQQPGFTRHCLSDQSFTFTTTEYTPH
ncbi:hypothetical protein BC941DRAFT_471457 [Chlamydoabsidia padenii]|nr:hypothetical protein BC941DRAFT_471457 [Chlamydoabsidia padenii]